MTTSAIILTIVLWSAVMGAAAYIFRSSITKKLKLCPALVADVVTEPVQYVWISKETFVVDNRVDGIMNISELMLYDFEGKKISNDKLKVTASSVLPPQGDTKFLESNLIDSDMQTFWHTQLSTSPGEWIKVTLNPPQKLRKVELYNLTDAAYGWGRRLLGTRVNIVDINNKLSLSSLITINDRLHVFNLAKAIKVSTPLIKTVYVTKESLGSSTDGTMNIAEVIFYDSYGVKLPTDNLNVTASTTHTPKYSPSNLVDGNTDTMWHSQITNTTGEWVKIDINPPKALQRIELVNRLNSEANVRILGTRVNILDDSDKLVLSTVIDATVNSYTFLVGLCTYE